MSFLTAIGDFYGGRAAGKQQQLQNQQSQAQIDAEKQRLALEQQQGAEQQRMDDAQLAALQTQNTQAAANRKFESGLKLPPDWNKMQPDQKVAYLQQRYSAAQAAGDDAAAQQTLALIASIPTGVEKLASAQYTTQGRLPLAQAQAGWWKQRHQEVEDSLRERFQAATAGQRAAMARAQMSAGVRLQTAQMSNDEKQYIATLTALNVANGRDETQAFQEAIAQYHTASAAWQQQSKLYDQGLAPNPGAPPTPQQFTVNMAPPPPGVITVNVTTPDGKVMKMPVVQSKLPQKTPPKALPPLAQVISEGEKRGMSHQEIRQKLIGAGYPKEAVMQALPVPTLGGGFGTNQ